MRIIKKALVYIVLLGLFCCNGYSQESNDRNKQIEEITKEIDNYKEKNKEYGWLYFGRGVQYIMIGEYDSAIYDFKKSLELGPITSTEHYSLSKLYLIKGKVEESKEILDKGFEFDSNSFYLYYQRAILNDYLRNDQKAIADYTHFINENRYRDFPFLHSFSLKRRFILQMANLIKPDINDVKVALKYNPKDCELYFLKGYIQYMTKDFKNSISSIEEAIKLNKDYNLSYMLLAKIYEDQEEYEKVQEYIDIAVEKGYSNYNVSHLFIENKFKFPAERMKNNFSTNKYKTTDEYPFIPLINLEEEISYYK